MPYLTIIVVNKDTRRPTYFSKELGWSDDKIQAKQAAVYNFEQWEDIRQAHIARLKQREAGSTE